MTLFRAGRQEVKVRILWICSWFLLYFVAYVTLAPFFGGEEASPEVWRGRAALAATLIGLCAAIALGMSVYVRCYVTRLALEPDGRSFSIRTLGLRGDRERSMDFARIESAYFREGGLADAPWWTLRVEGRRLPFILDARGEVKDLTRFTALLVGVPLDAPPEKVGR